MTVVLDASAVLALLLGEPGADEVRQVLPGSVVSVVGLAEVLSKLADRGAAIADLPRQLASAGVRVEAATEVDAVEVARLRVLDLGRVLSLGDRFCLALARRLEVEVWTGDRVWREVDCGVHVVLLR